MNKTIINNMKSITAIIVPLAILVFGYGVFRAESQNTKEKVKENTESIKFLKESISNLLRIVELEKLDKQYVKISIKRIERTMKEMKEDIKEILKK